MKKQEIAKHFEKSVKFLSGKKIQTIIIIFLLLAILTFGAWIRIQNIPALKDVTTGEYIPIELDTFYFLRIAETIVEHGKLPEYDNMRDPMTPNVEWAPDILPKIIVLIYKIINALNFKASLHFADIIYPVIYFILSVIAFFFLIYFLTKSKWLALISSGLLAVIPPFLYRTMAGFSDHDILGMFAFFLALLSFTATLKIVEKKKKSWTAFILGGLITGISLTFTLVSWGGVSKFLFMTLPVAFLILWLTKIKEKEILPKYLGYYVFLIVGVFI